MPSNPRFDSSHLIENRQIRVFLSSTFSDMESERNALVKMFGRLKIEANRRNVELTLIDLRWGVTEEEARRGKVLSVCLNEIEHSHPFFIGLLGSRYGYAPEMSEIEKNPELKERYPWVVEDISDGLSITEMEMEYGVLRNTVDIDAAFFIKQSDSPDDNPRLTSLKTKIRDQKQYPVANYSTKEQLCQQAEDELRRILDKHFPETEITPLDRERTAQRAYINSCHTNYLKRQSYFDIIDDFVHSDERNLVLTGDSGVGKSALLANWVKENENNDDFNLFYHFVGNSFSDNNYEDILRHLCDGINELYHFEKRDNNKGIIEEANDLLNVVAVQEKRLIIVIDGINQIATRTNEKLLLWLPAANDKVKFLFSTLKDDETMHVFELRNYRVETVMPLSSKEREHFVVGYLGNYGKRLSDSQLRRIVDDPENTNTLVLKSLLDELICFGSYEYLDSRIEYYLSAPSITDFFDRVLSRMEDDYSANGDLVRRTLILIAISERGLSEDELLAILGCRQLDWHLFLCAFYNHFVVKNGLITFSHQYVASAVENRYHTSDESKIASFRQEIVSFFSTGHNEDKSVTDRCISELAHQYYKLADWKNLYRILLSLEAFEYYYDTDQSLLGTYWRALLNADKKYSLSAYMKLHSKQGALKLASDLYNIAFFIQDYIADYKMALKFYFKALKIQERKLGELAIDTAASYNNIGYVQECLCDYKKALHYYEKSLKIRKKILDEKHQSIAESYNNIGSVYDGLSEYEEAINYYSKALEISQATLPSDHPNIATIYNNIALLYCDLDNYDVAMEYFAKALKIDETLFGENHQDTAASYDNICSVYDYLTDYEKSLEFHNKALRIRKKLFGNEHPDIASSYNCIGSVYEEIGDFDTALEYYEKALEIRVSFLGSEHIETATCYNNIGAVLDSKQDYNRAIEYYSKALKVYESVFGKKHPDTANIYNNIGVTCYHDEKYDKSLIFLNKALKIRKGVLGLKNRNTADVYDNLGLVFLQLECFDTALEYCEMALKIMREIFGDNNRGTATCYNNVGGVYSMQCDYVTALKYYRKALKIRKKVLGEKNLETVNSYDNIGSVFYKVGNYHEAIKYYRKSLKIQRKIFGEICLDNADKYSGIGFLYKNIDEYDKSIWFYRKSMMIYKKILGDSHPETLLVQERINEVKQKMGKNSSL